MSGWLSMQLEAAGRPLQQVWREGRPMPGPGQVALRVLACGVCRTDLHLADTLVVGQGLCEAEVVRAVVGLVRRVLVAVRTWAGSGWAVVRRVARAVVAAGGVRPLAVAMAVIVRASLLRRRRGAVPPPW